jgi:hypothetical protein
MHPTAGSLYWLGLRDSTGATLDGAKSYKLTVPQPVPGKLFWSVTVYDTDTRSQVQTDQGKAALRSMFELKDVSKTQPTDLYFGPTAPQGHENQWIKTIPGKGWFVYFRVYGPEQAAFDGSWKPSDFEQVKLARSRTLQSLVLNYFSAFSAQKSHVKPPNHLNLSKHKTSAWHVSFVQSAILDIDRK